MAIIVVIKRLPATAMAIYPFLLLKNKTLKVNAVVLNHEKIHFRQQLELLVLPFYLLYLTHYLVNRLKKQNHYNAYMNIAFEKEAYLNEQDLTYNKNRKWFAWLKYL